MGNHNKALKTNVECVIILYKFINTLKCTNHESSHLLRFVEVRILIVIIPMLNLILKKKKDGLASATIIAYNYDKSHVTDNRNLEKPE